MSSANNHSPSANPFPLAIVGIGCRFPGEANDVESFWNMLIEGRSGICEVPPDRWSLARYYHPDRAVPGAIVTRYGGFVSGLNQFDAAFWGMSQREAIRMDPQQRWLLEAAWEALEDSGTPPRKVRGTQVGVFVGISSSDYAVLQMPNIAHADVHTISGTTLSIAANRVSYMLDLQGPSLSVDTACSSALVAVWLAGRSIWSGACDSAIVGGVNALIIPETTLGFSKASMLSPDGQCFAFDARANGYVRGEGVGAIYIKPLDRALADGNRVYAVLRAAASNQDGHTSSMTVPSADGQAALLREAYQQAGVDPSDVVYIEAHGTGTPVGDPIEAAALGRVVGARRTTANACLIGSVKTNIGHLEAGSGIAGLIKAALILHREQIPPNQNFTAPNPQIPFDELGLRVVSRLQALPKPAVGKPVVGINSFGFGGSNAHVVLEQAPAARAEPICDSRIARPQVLTISGASPAALRAYVEGFHSLLAEPELPLADVCYTAAAHKEHHEHRLGVVAENASEMQQLLAAWLEGGATNDGLVAGRVAPARSTPVFVYSGQGGQWWRMGRDLLEREPVFRQTAEQIDSLLKDLTDWSLLEEMMRPESESRIDRTDIAQPMIFALQVALTELWQSWGVRPGRVVGHSVGEVAAAYVAGIYSLGDAVKVIVHRARLQHTTYGAGRMAAVGVSQDEAALAIGPDADCVHVAAVNGPKLVTLAGDTEPLEEIVRGFEHSGKFVRWLRVAYAFHTHQMDPLRDALLRNLADIRPRSASIPFVSTVTGSELQGTELTAEYWWRNIRQPVLFYPAVDYLVRHDADVFLEVSPHPALTSSIKECLGEHDRTGAVVHSLRRGADESRAMLVNLMGLHLADVAPDWGVVNQSRRMFHRLPSYPWQRETFWLESKQSQEWRLSAPEHPLLGLRTGNVRPTWRAEWNLQRLSFLVDHRFWGSAVFPAAGHVEIGAALARTLFPNEPYVVENLLFKKAMYLGDNKTSLIQVEFEPESKTFSVFASVDGEAGDEWNLHAQGQLTRLAPRPLESVDPDELRRRLPEYLSHEDYYRDMTAAGYQFGPNFKLLQNVWRQTGEIMGEILVPEHLVAEGANYCLHPAVTDACFQLFKGLDPTLTSDDFFLPASVRRIRITGVTTPPRLWVHGRLVEREDNRMVCDASAYDEQGRLVAEVVGLCISRVDQQRTADVTDQSLYQFNWEPAPPRVNTEANSFPSSTEITAAAKSDLAEAYEKCGLRQYYEQFLPRANAMARRDVRRAWSQLGWRPRVGERITPQDLSDRLGIAPNHRRLTHAHLSSQTACGWLREMEPEAWAVVREPDGIRFNDCWRSLITDYPKFSSEAVLLELAGANLATVLQGAVNPVELLFPKGSGDLVERFYDEARDFPVHSQLLHNALRRILTSLPENRRLRVLEIGAGTGSLTRRMIPALHEANPEYVFTDLSPAFIAAGRKKFAEFSFIEYKTFDIEKDPQAQGLKANSFDLVVGSLVVHATSDLKRVLGHLHSCLAPGGMLLFLEAFPPQVSYDHIFGQLPGWWLYHDGELRQHTPLLDRERWIALLDECGFTDAGSFAAEFDEQQADHAYLFAFAPREATVVRRPADKQAGRTYVVFADEGGIGRRIGDRLRQLGHPVAYVRAGDEYQRLRAGEYMIDAASADHLGKVRDDVCHSDGLAGVVHCWCLDHPPASTMSLETLWDSQRTGLLSATQVMLMFSDVSRQPIWFITRDGRHVADGDGVEGVASSPLVGLLRVANNERFPSRFGQLDLDGPPNSETLCNICAEITDSDGELEIAYRRGRRHVLRLGRAQADRMPVRKFNAVGGGGKVTPFRLQTSKPGVLTNLALHETRRRAPESHEVEIRVRAGGVNFRDVLKALGIHPGNSPDLLWFGDDVAGVVERVGSDVRHLQPGDAVVGFAEYALQSFVTYKATSFTKMPRNMSFEESAAVPTVFLTAHYALSRLARMQRGESILIHAGAGGVGQAAIQVAKHLGLRIFATAGSPEKRRICQDLGAHHVMSSRNLDFADEIMAITEGRGVDAVLNSLAGDFIPKSLSVLAPFGRFLEIGKIDVYKNTRLGLEALKNNISFSVIDVLAFRTAVIEEIWELLEAGAYRPIMHTCFPITEAAEAFRQIAQGTSIGKNVLSFDQPEIPIGLCTDDSERFDADAAYLISGGAGGFGLELADWMGRRGARCIALLSRGGPRDEEARQKIENLRLAGVQVLDLRGDVANLDDVKRCVAQAAAVAPLKGVIHAAMVLDDDFLGELNEDRFHTALAPKMAGAWNLHVATTDQPLEHFISFSSVSSVIGAPKQANYNAGNSFLEGLAHYRRAHGLPALTINWGLLLGAGYVERNRATAKFLESAGQRAISIAEALEAFGRFTLLDIPQVVAARVDWLATSKLCPSMTHSPTWSALMQETSGAARGGSLLAHLNENDAGARAKLVEAFVAAQLAEVVGVKAESIDYDISLNRLGLDSLMALELANRLERELGTSLQMASLLGGPSVKALAQSVLKSLARQGDSIQSSESHEAQPVTTIATTLNAAPARDSTSARRNNGHAAETSGSSATFLRVLGGAEAERELSRQTFEAAALLYAPDRLKTVGGLSDEQIPALLGEKPFVSHIYDLAYGKIGVVTLPVLGKDLLRSPRLPELTRSAIDLARQYGARCVSLTGLIPSATRYGLDVQEWSGAPTPTITTGHATTTAAVILNLESLLLNAGRSLQDESLAVLGLGSIGQACLELAMRVLPHPRSIHLCDIFGKLKNLHAIAERLRDEYGYHGQVEVLLSADKLPAEFYRATTILTAVSVPNLIDVDRLRPGAILIDDSYPPAFALDRAIKRAETKGDLLFSNAGMSRAPDPIRETVFLSQAAGEEMVRYGAEAFRAEFVRDPRELTACFLSSLLTNRFEGFCPTIGLASPDDVLSHFHGLMRMGIGPARPQCGNYLMPDEIARNFRHRFGSSRLGESVTR